jgi:hypothetical protein
MIKPLCTHVACLILLLPALAACSRGEAVEDLVPEHSFKPLEAALAQLQPATAPVNLRLVPVGDASQPFAIQLEEVFGQEAQHAPRLRFQVEARWEGALTASEGGVGFQASACRASSSPQVPDLEQAVCGAPARVAGGPDSLGAAWLARLGASPLSPGQALTLDLGQVQQGEGRLALKATVSLAGVTAEGGHPVARIGLEGTGRLAARPDKAFAGVLEGKVTGLALAEFARDGEGLVRLQGVTWLDWHGQVRGAEGEVADSLHQVQSIAASWSRPKP